MSMQDPVSDLLTRIRNAQRASHAEVSMPSSRTKQAICKVLQDEGYIASFECRSCRQADADVQLRYHNGAPVIEEIARVADPDCGFTRPVTSCRKFVAVSVSQ